MGRTTQSSKNGFNRGAWTSLEDKLLADYVSIHGEGKWSNASKKTGLRRCGKSCRLRWLNYLRPDIKRGNISRDEEELIVRLHKLLGNRWSLIAGRLPGRTDNEIKNYWNSNLAKKLEEFQLSLPKLQNSTKQLLATTARTPPTSTPVPIVRVHHENISDDDQKREVTDQEATWPSSGDDEINAHDFLIDFNMEDLSQILETGSNNKNNGIEEEDDEEDYMKKFPHWEDNININESVNQSDQSDHELINGSDSMMSLVPNFFDSQLLDWSAMS